MTNPENNDFPIPRLSGGFYAGYIFHMTAGNGGELITAGPKSAAVLERETRWERHRIAQMQPRNLAAEALRELRNTVRTSVGELAAFHSVAAEEILSGNGPELQAYLTGPVNEDGLELAKQIGWLTGEPPENPFHNRELLHSMRQRKEASRLVISIAQGSVSA
jgi:hypothetical protein